MRWQFSDSDFSIGPLHYIQATTKVASASRRVGSSSRPVARTPPIDFDEVPSPRPQGNRSTRTPRPSRLSQAIASGSFFDDDPELDGAPEVEMNGSDALDDFAGQNGMDDFGEDSPPHRSFQEMDRDDEDDELGQNHDDILPPDLSRISVKAKGKSRQMDDGIEDDIGQGLDNIGPQSDEEPAPRKVTKKKKKDVQPKKIVKILPQKENRGMFPFCPCLEYTLSYSRCPTWCSQKFPCFYAPTRLVAERKGGIWAHRR